MDEAQWVNRNSLIEHGKRVLRGRAIKGILDLLHEEMERELDNAASKDDDDSPSDEEKCCGE